jgi:hypothetical protein
MQVIDLAAVVRHALRRCVSSQRHFSKQRLLMIALLALGACDEPKPAANEPVGPVGRVEFNLVGQGSQGSLFRLRDAVVTVQGPDRTLFFDSEENPDETSFSAVLPAGSYSSFLQEGWHLERLDTSKVVANATLLSSNPDFFEVLEGDRTRVALRFQVERDVVVTDPGLLEITLEVEEAASASAFCSSDAECSPGQVCCIAGFLGTCQTLAAGATCPLPDLTVLADQAQASLIIDQEFFPPDSCAIAEECVSGTGTRKLLRFSTVTPNIGESDLVLGDPSSTPGFEFAQCHGHFHFNGYARYELVDATGAIVAVGHKQAFCLLDSIPIGLPGAPTEGRFHCGFQGLTRGFADIYDNGLDCQWVDITDVPDGDYLLRISINPDHVIPESNFDNNTIEVPVTVAPIDPLSSCAAPSVGLSRECGWGFAAGFEGASCEPGELLMLGCGCSTPDSCEGDPMLRVCEGTTACSSATAIASIDDTCGVCPQLEFKCPPSGTYSLLSASFASDLPFLCNVQGP